ncbi:MULTISPECIES: Mor transcription activator family protein [Ralstonia solanacearum species complex]|nr:Mor transcription activator family protein [Ralstonia solanacearum]
MQKPETLALLPPVIRELVDLIGFEATMALVRAFGGLVIWVPKGVQSVGSTYEAISEVIGAEATDLLIRRYGGDRISIARCQQMMTVERWRRIIADFERGDSAAEIARRHRITERAVWIILKKPVPAVSPHPAQASLF